MKLHWPTDFGVKIVTGYFLITLLIISCNFDVPEASQIAYKGSDRLLRTEKLSTNGCEIIPYFAPQFNFDNFNLGEVVNECFNTVWTKNFPSLIFQQVELSSKAKIRIEITDTNNKNFKDSLDYFDHTIANMWLKPTTFVERTVDGNFVIYVNRGIPWTKGAMIKALSYQIGRIMGMQRSNLENDNMNHIMYFSKEDTAQNKLSENDIKELSRLYPKVCDISNRWTVRKSRLPAYFNETNKYSLPVTFSLPGNDTLYLLWPNKTSNDYKFHKIVFNTINPQLDFWGKEESLKIIGNISSEAIQPAGIYAFTVGNRAFIGSSQLFTNPKSFFEYTPKTGSFTARAISLNTNREVYSIGIGGPNNKGYVLNVNQDDALKSSISIFDPSNISNSWTSISVPEPFYTATTIFYTQENSLCFYNGFAAYFLNAQYQWSKFTFNTSDPNTFIEPRNIIVGANELSLKAFNIGNKTFLIRDNYGVDRNRIGAGVDNEVMNDELWEIDLPSFRFKSLASVPAQGIILSAFGHKGSGCILTSKGYLYSYSP